MSEFAVFPLGTVLLPGQLLPLQVFEPRYRVMLFDLRDSDPAEFVVVLIERGSEVGGGDQRARVGCVARVLEQQELSDGRSMIVALGTRAVRVQAWLEEDPYPRALLEPLDEVLWEPSQESLAQLTERASEVMSLAALLGAPQLPEGLVLSEDPVARLWQLAIATPLATLDRQRLLSETDPARRAGLLEGFLAEQKELLGARIGWKDGPDAGTD